mgnify:FL=1
MAEKKRLNLAFSMASPLQREAWQLLSAVPPGQRTDAVCHAVCRVQERDSLLDALRAMLREELGGPGYISTTEKCVQPQEAGDVGDDVLGFLLALQNDGGDEKPDPLF